MTIETVKAVTERFLGQEDSGVLALKGDWGVGKTYAWMELVKKNKDRIRPKTYSYVSLFGLSSLPDLRMAILANSQTTEIIGKPVTFDVINRNWQRFGIAQVSQLWNRIGQLSKGVSVTFEALAPMLVRNMVICLDDFERLNTERVSHEELMGFVSNLKERAGCKIVFILNDSKLPDGENAYLKYREKVVDVELRFSPTAEEAVLWGLPEGLWERERVRTCALALDIRNVRILNKIVQVIGILAQVLNGMHEQVRETAIRSAVLIAWCYFDKSGGAPPLEFFRRWNTMTAALKKEKEKPTPEELRWEGLLGGYRFFPYSDIDLAVENVIVRGYAEESGLAEEATKLDATYRDGDKEQQFIAAWKLFRDSFDNNEAEIVEGLRDGLKKAVHQTTPVNLSGTAALLRELGQEQIANELIDYYVEQRANDRDVFDLQHNPFAHHITDVPTREALKKGAAVLVKIVPLRQAVETMARERGWSVEDEGAVAAATVEEFYQLFKGKLSVPLRNAVHSCLQFGPPKEQIAKRAEEALRRIASESNVNRVRVSRLGVEVTNMPMGNDDVGLTGPRDPRTGKRRPA
jgi:hypothetical protein